jgi:signal peptidase I
MKKRVFKKFICSLWKEWRLTLSVIVFVIIPVKSSVADWNWVPSGSMNPTIREGDLIFVNKMAYGLRFPLTMRRLTAWADPARGDIVVCFEPDSGIRLVKRVIAVPGDTIEMRNEALFLNGQPLKYDRADLKYMEAMYEQQKINCILAAESLDGFNHPIMITPSVRAIRNFQSIKVPDGKYFVMGDNRDLSKDSRYFGFVERNAIVGKAKAVIVSFDINDYYQPRLTRFLTSLK